MPPSSVKYESRYFSNGAFRYSNETMMRSIDDLHKGVAASGHAITPSVLDHNILDHRGKDRRTKEWLAEDVYTAFATAIPKNPKEISSTSQCAASLAVTSLSARVTSLELAIVEQHRVLEDAQACYAEQHIRPQMALHDAQVKTEVSHNQQSQQHVASSIESEAAQQIVSMQNSNHHGHKERAVPTVGFGEALLILKQSQSIQDSRKPTAQSNKIGNRCAYCHGEHMIQNCPNNGLSKAERGRRWAFRLCFRCGGPSHTSYSCPEKGKGKERVVTDSSGSE